jgi:hypothetical protein
MESNSGMEISPQFFVDENADLNDMTDEIHNKRLADALARFWDVQAQEMVIYVYISQL